MGEVIYVVQKRLENGKRSICKSQVQTSREARILKEMEDRQVDKDLAEFLVDLEESGEFSECSSST
jgi:Trm5-related predicted tRNA methylase